LQTGHKPLIFKGQYLFRRKVRIQVESEGSCQADLKSPSPYQTPPGARLFPPSAADAVGWTIRPCAAGGRQPVIAGPKPDDHR
jgi:hypothetical protein